MIKKILVYLCVFLLVLSAAAGSFAELSRVVEDTEGINTLIYYVPARTKSGTKTDITAATAQSIANAICTLRQGKTDVYLNRYNALNKNMLENPTVKELEGMIQSGTDDGNSELRSMPKDLPKAYETWFIVPGSVAANLIQNATLMKNCREILSADEKSVLHFVFITDNALSIQEDSELGKLAAEGKTDWIFILPESSTVKADGELHTESYLLASLLGEPVDLNTEQAENRWIYELPDESKALVLVDWNEDKPGTVEVRNEAGILCDTVDTFNVTAGNVPVLSGTTVPRMEKGQYTVSISSGTTNSVKVYWYPRLDDMEPQLQLADVWQRGTNEIVLSMGGTIGRPDQYTVNFSYLDNEDEKTATGMKGKYDDERDAWVKERTVGSGVQHVYIDTTVEMKMADGNRIREWRIPRVIRDIQTSGVSVRSETLTEATLYTDRVAGTAGEAEYSWEVFFRYNKDDHPTFTIKADEENTAAEDDAAAGDEATGEEQEEPVKKDPGITFVHLGNEKGFRITAKNGENLVDTLTVVLQGSVMGEDGQEITSEEKKITFTRRDVSELFSGISFSAEPADEDAETVIAGEELTVKAVIPEETLADWSEACEQLEGFPKPETLQLFCALGENGQFGEGTSFDTEPLTAAAVLEIPALTKAGVKTVRTAIRAEGSEKDLVTEKLSADVQNNPPFPDQESDFGVQKTLTLKGFPWEYEEMDLLKACFDTNKPFELFRDDADNLTKVTIQIEKAEGLELPDGFEVNKEGTVWTMEVLDAEDVVPIRVAHSSILAILDHHTIRLIPTDGVNNTEEPFEVYEVSFQVFSEYMTYASYAIAGLVLLLILLLIIRIIRQAVKPSFESISIRCYASSDEDQEEIAEIMNKSNPIPMYGFKKKPVSLATVLILSRQPALGSEYAGAAKDIQILPAKHNGLTVLFGKEALKAIGRHEKKETIAFGKSFRMRIGNQYILIENVQPGS